MLHCLFYNETVLSTTEVFYGVSLATEKNGEYNYVSHFDTYRTAASGNRI